MVVTDLGCGDAGKGSVVDSLARTTPTDLVVRFSGGAQAAHNVVTPSGQHHTFAQFGSATLVGVPTLLSRFMMVDPLALAAEAQHLHTLGVIDPLGLVRVEGSALLTTPLHARANQAREVARGAARHGSCGMGVGETQHYAITHPGDAPVASDGLRPAQLLEKLELLRTRLEDELGPLPSVDLESFVEVVSEFAHAVELVGPDFLAAKLQVGRVLFEGSQGVLLDQWWGFHPYTTWSSTTSENARTLLRECDASAEHLGVVRSYAVRHGPGPLVSEDSRLSFEEPHNTHGRWQGGFRRGHFDAITFDYALRVDRPDSLAVTHMDRWGSSDPGLVDSYQTPDGALSRLPDLDKYDLAAREDLTRRLLRASPSHVRAAPRLPERLEELVGLPVTMLSHGPTHRDKVARLTRTYA